MMRSLGRVGEQWRTAVLIVLSIFFLDRIRKSEIALTAKIDMLEKQYSNLKDEVSKMNESESQQSYRAGKKIENHNDHLTSMEHDIAKLMNNNYEAGKLGDTVKGLSHSVNMDRQQLLDLVKRQKEISDLHLQNRIQHLSDNVQRLTAEKETGVKNMQEKIQKQLADEHAIMTRYINARLSKENGEEVIETPSFKQLEKPIDNMQLDAVDDKPVTKKQKQVELENGLVILVDDEEIPQYEVPVHKDYNEDKLSDLTPIEESAAISKKNEPKPASIKIVTDKGQELPHYEQAQKVPEYEIPHHKDYSEDKDETVVLPGGIIIKTGPNDKPPGKPVNGVNPKIATHGSIKF